MVALYHENIEQHPKRTSLLRHYKDQWNWRNVKATYKEKINPHKPTGWCVNSTLVYGDVFDPLKMYRGKDVCREHWRWGKSVVWNISTTINDRD